MNQDLLGGVPAKKNHLHRQLLLPPGAEETPTPTALWAWVRVLDFTGNGAFVCGLSRASTRASDGRHAGSAAGTETGR